MGQSRNVTKAQEGLKQLETLVHQYLHHGSRIMIQAPFPNNISANYRSLQVSAFCPHYFSLSLKISLGSCETFSDPMQCTGLKGGGSENKGYRRHFASTDPMHTNISNDRVLRFSYCLRHLALSSLFTRLHHGVVT